MKNIILCDFDGTITTEDTLVKILDRFTGGAWRIIGKKILDNELGAKIGLKLEFGLCDPKNVTKEAVVQMLNEEINIDPYFKPFLEFCKNNIYEFIIVSGGFSLCIDTILKKYGLGNLPYYANKILFEKRNIDIDYPYPSNKCDECGNCKTMHLERYRKMGYYIIYIGDSITDRCPAKHADLVFSKGRLSDYCVKENIAHINYETFADIQEYLLKNNTSPHTAVWGMNTEDTTGGTLERNGRK
jgi:2-hydroxy-3-keto-5-methylthiopentenyl-1-phosphate phosphatase